MKKLPEQKKPTKISLVERAGEARSVARDARQQLRLAKESYKKARKLFKEAKRDAKKAEKDAEKLAKDVKRASSVRAKPGSRSKSGKVKLAKVTTGDGVKLIATQKKKVKVKPNLKNDSPNKNPKPPAKSKPAIKSKVKKHVAGPKAKRRRIKTPVAVSIDDTVPVKNEATQSSADGAAP